MGFAQSDCEVSRNETFGQARALKTTPKLRSKLFFTLWKTGVFCLGKLLL